MVSAVQFKCNTVQKKCNTSANYTSKFWIMIGWKTMADFLSQWYHVKWWRNFGAKTLKKVFSSLSNMIFRHFLLANFFMFILLISYHTIFLVQFGINLHLWVFQKAFWKTQSCKFQIEVQTVRLPILITIKWIRHNGTAMTKKYYNVRTVLKIQKVIPDKNLM